jgi:hypothetical protein
MSDRARPASKWALLHQKLVLDRAIYRAAVVFAVINGLVYIGWVAMYVSATFFPTAAGWAGPDAVGYVNSLPLFRHAFIYVAAMLGWLVSILTVLRHRFLPAICIIALFAATLDWVETSLVPRSAEGIADQLGYMHLIIYAIVGGLNLAMWRRQMLR